MTEENVKNLKENLSDNSVGIYNCDHHNRQGDTLLQEIEGLRNVLERAKNLVPQNFKSGRKCCNYIYCDGIKLWGWWPLLIKLLPRGGKDNCS